MAKHKFTCQMVLTYNCFTEPSGTLATNVFEAERQGDITRVVQILRSALLGLRTNPNEPDKNGFVSMLNISKKRPGLFSIEPILEVRYMIIRIRL